MTYLDLSSNQNVTVKGTLYYLDNNKKRKPYTFSTISMAIQTGTGEILADPVTVSSDGTFTIPGIPRFTQSSYPITIKSQDSAGVFMDNMYDSVVQKGTGSEVEIGDFQAVTPTGIVPSDNRPLDNQEPKEGIINLKVVSEDSGVDIAGVTVELHETNSIFGKLLQTKTTSSSGEVSFVAKYGAYNVFVKDDGWVDKSIAISLQASVLNYHFTVEPENIDFDMRLTLNVDQKPGEGDIDYEMKAMAPDGKICRVSKINKYCAYTEHGGDIYKGKGTEFINIKRLSVAKYMTYIRPTPQFAATCPQAAMTEGVHLSEYEQNDGIQWSNVPMSSTDKKIYVSFSTQQAPYAAPTGTDEMPVRVNINTDEDTEIANAIID